MQRNPAIREPNARRDDAFRALLKLGWSDREVAEAFNASSTQIKYWRKKNNIEAGQRKPIDHEKALSMYEAGASDAAIGKAVGVTQSGVTRWRQRLGLEPNHMRLQKMAASERRKALKLLRQGAAAKVVAEQLGVCKKTILLLRGQTSSEGMRKHGDTTFNRRKKLQKNPEIYHRIEQAVGVHLPEHIREEAAADMLADLYSGLLTDEHIERTAPKYRSRAFDMCGSHFGAISIDSENDDGLKIVDMLADPSTLDYSD